MEVNLTPDTEKKLRDFAELTGRGMDDLVEDAVAVYFDDVQQARLHVEEGYTQAQRGELIDGDLAHREIQDLKAAWRQQHAQRQ